MLRKFHQILLETKANSFLYLALLSSQKKTVLLYNFFRPINNNYAGGIFSLDFDPKIIVAHVLVYLFWGADFGAIFQ